MEASQSKAAQSSSDVLAVGASVGAEGFAELVFYLDINVALFTDCLAGNWLRQRSNIPTPSSSLKRISCSTRLLPSMRYQHRK